MKYVDSPLWREDLERQVAALKAHITRLESEAEHREMLAATRSAFVPDWRFKSVKPEPNHHQSTPGRVSWIIRGAA